MPIYLIKQLRYFNRGFKSFRSSKELKFEGTQNNLQQTKNELRKFFESKNTGRGIWKWDHYFDIYDKHFSKFKGKNVNILEVGIYSGGSIEMWMKYFGSGCTFYGVDIEESCKVYESDNVHIFIGDQQDPEFWNKLKLNCPKFDIVIDDGGHQAMQQIVTLEEVLDHINPGGVYICEDIHHDLNSFTFFSDGLAHKLNEFQPISDHDNQERRLTSKASNFQSSIGSISYYPFLLAIEKNEYKMKEFVAGKRGDLWQPFLK